jgi:hypothetical protein
MIYEFFRKPLGWAVGAILLILAAWWLYSALTRDARTEARLSRNQTTAAQNSGRDAVNTVAEAANREAGDADLTRSNEMEIRNAEGSDAIVADPAHDAGLRSLCRRRSYRSDPRCVQYANPD